MFSLPSQIFWSPHFGGNFLNCTTAHHSYEHLSCCSYVQQRYACERKNCRLLTSYDQIRCSCIKLPQVMLLYNIADQLLTSSTTSFGNTNPTIFYKDESYLYVPCVRLLAMRGLEHFSPMPSSPNCTNVSNKRHISKCKLRNVATQAGVFVTTPYHVDSSNPYARYLLLLIVSRRRGAVNNLKMYS